jgi:hypothetical protein
VKRIQLLNSDSVALVDDEDYDLLSNPAFRWRLNNNGYPEATVLMHKLVANHERVDHRNQDPLDSRKKNLRHATRGQNRTNAKANRNSATGFKGVSYRRRGNGVNKFEAAIRKDGRATHLGCFPTAELAGEAYDNAARNVWGEFACVNFPRPGEVPARHSHEEGNDDVQPAKEPAGRRAVNPKGSGGA